MRTVDVLVYLLRIEEAGEDFQALSVFARQYVREWLRMANFATKQLFLFRQQG